MSKVLVGIGEVLFGLLVVAVWSALIFRVIAVIDTLTNKRARDYRRLRQDVARVRTKARPVLDALGVCPGFALAVAVYLCVIGPWLPAALTLPPGTHIRPMGWAVMSWLVCGVVTYTGTPLAAVDILRSFLPGRRSRAGRLWGVSLGLAALAASLYASHLPNDVLFGMASWRGWVIEE